MFFLLRYDILPGKMRDHDEFVRTKMLPFWTSQPDCKAVEIFEDVLVGYPERTVMIEVDDLTALQHILSSPDYRSIRDGLQDYITDAQSQILNLWVKKP